MVNGAAKFVAHLQPTAKFARFPLIECFSLHPEMVQICAVFVNEQTNLRLRIDAWGARIGL